MILKQWRILLSKFLSEVSVATLLVTLGLSAVNFSDYFLPWPINDGFAVRLQAAFGLVFLFFVLFGYAINYVLFLFLTESATVRSRIIWRAFGFAAHVFGLMIMMLLGDSNGNLSSAYGQLISLCFMLGVCGVTAIIVVELSFHFWKSAS